MNLHLKMAAEALLGLRGLEVGAVVRASDASAVGGVDGPLGLPPACGSPPFAIQSWVCQKMRSGRINLQRKYSIKELNQP